MPWRRPLYAMALLRRRIYKRVPRWIRKHDFELFAAFLCLTAGVPLLFTDEVAAESVDATLPLPLVRVWAFFLAASPIAITIGLIKSSSLPLAEATVWMRLEAVGLRALAYAGYVYSLCIFFANGFHALPALAIIVAFALTCHSRATAVVTKVEEFLDILGAGDDHPPV